MMGVRDGLQRGTKKAWGVVIKMFHVFIVVVITWIHICLNSSNHTLKMNELISLYPN